MQSLKSILARIAHFPWYPLVFSAYPVLALLSVNFDQLNPALAVRPLLVFMGGSLLVFLLLRALTRDWHRAALVTLLFEILFSTYGHVEALLRSEGLNADPGRFLIPLWIGLFALTAWLATRRSLPFSKLTSSLNVVSLVLLVFPVYQISYFLISEQVPLSRQDDVLTERVVPSPNQALPDVYYIILDSYGRSDLLQQAYGYDNSEFINALTGLGFYVASCSQSNYVRTEQSLASSLNMDYLPAISNIFVPNDIDRLPLWKLLKRNAVRDMFKRLGYRTVSYATGFSWSELYDSDSYLAPSVMGLMPSEFEALLWQTTFGEALQELGVMNTKTVPADRDRERTRFVLDSLEMEAEQPGPKFVFVHIISPHPPFVFGPAGRPLDPEQFKDENGNYSAAGYAAGYQLQLDFISAQMVAAVRKIIEESPIPPLIIIQGDHAPWFQPKEKSFNILNAYYFPGHADSLYPTVSPVNTFRLIFNQYLGGNFPLLQDSSYFSPIPHIYDFTFIPNTCTDTMEK